MTNAGLLDLWTEPQERECLGCYVSRLLADFGCDSTLRWTLRWRAMRAPGVAALDRLFRRHDVKCDCGVPAALGAAARSERRPHSAPRRAPARPHRARESAVVRQGPARCGADRQTLPAAPAARRLERQLPDRARRLKPAPRHFR
ncbi:DUF2695 domain-containing protein [Amycolatopsis thermoflava]|uniref:DUF2695 domain-containing protein n=1 Tax=Amycolatopsis thermoflava TaxID=84480 RepID=UPI00364F56C0